MSQEGASGWRTWGAAGIFLTLIVAGVLISQPDAKPTPAPDAKAATPPSTAVRAIPTPLPPLSRADLIDAAARAASRFASGEQAPASDLHGRRFALSLPFGCAGPVADLKTVQAGWSYDPEDGTLRAKVTPQVWTDAPILRTIAANVDFEQAEGFWIDRPWQLSDSCPVREPVIAQAAAPAPEGAKSAPSPSPSPATPETAPASSRETLGLVELFGPGTKRAEQRNGRAYEAVETIQPGELALDRGLRLVVEGRLVGIADGQTVGCWAEARDRRPTCLIRVRFDRVAITGPTGERILAEWKS